MHAWGDKDYEALKLWSLLRQWRETVHRVWSEKDDQRETMNSYQADLLILQCGGVPPKED